jgi:hypothetical protein
MHRTDATLLQGKAIIISVIGKFFPSFLPKMHCFLPIPARSDAGEGTRTCENPREDLAKSTGGFDEIHTWIWAKGRVPSGLGTRPFFDFCKCLENRTIENRKNYCREVAKVLQRSLQTSAEKLGIFSAEVLA